MSLGSQTQIQYNNVKKIQIKQPQIRHKKIKQLYALPGFKPGSDLEISLLGFWISILVFGFTKAPVHMDF